ncbi:glycosyltransferase family 4 protein [Novosphingopyxis iocasae]|uniref:glycosyltransferase family 4 protein n=1 Tax=Novosphingopyxis iocasae TaxID=2762729 RepID=UPI001650FE7E|nr:glycosyltransferase family 4 protein [Novosphingopyxis iocasae]
MKITLITSGAITVPNFRGLLIQSLNRQGHNLSAMAPDWNDELRERTRAYGAEPVDIALDRAGVHPIRDALNCWLLAGQLRRTAPDAVLCYFAKPAIFGTLAAWIARVPRRIALIEGLGYVFTEGEDSGGAKRWLLRTITKLLYRNALRAADKVAFLNEDDAGQFRAMGLVTADKIIVLGGIGVDLQELKPSSPPAGPPSFIMMARLLREKGVREYVAAARIVKARHPDARFVLLGDRDANPGSVSWGELDAWIADGIVEWPGHVDNVPEWLSDASVFVLPSYREGVPRSTQEAAALGRAVITTDAVGCRETVVDGRNGFVVPVRSVDELAEAMERFVKQPELVARMGAESRALAEERFDALRWNERMTKLLTEPL